MPRWRIDRLEKKDEFYIPEEIAEWIGLKKSEYLSKLITLQSPTDIGIEEFHKFDRYIQGTIEEADRTLQAEVDGNLVRTYLRTYGEEKTFHQIVIGAVIKNKGTKDEIFVPILSFVSRNHELIKEFCQGEVINRPTLN